MDKLLVEECFESKNRKLVVHVRSDFLSAFIVKVDKAEIENK